MTARPVRIVVPCFDEADRIDPDGLLELLKDPDVGVLFVNDGSTDDTSAVLHRLAGAEPQGRIAVLDLERNGGKAEAVRRGLRLALDDGASVVGYYDVDLATPPAELLRLLSVLADGPALEVVMGSRVALLGRDIRRSRWRHWTGRVFATAASLCLGVPVYDTQCGAKVFRATPALREAVATPFAARWTFDVELLSRLLHPAAAPALPVERMVEVPLRQWTDVAGSKVSPSSLSRTVVEASRTLGASWALRRRDHARPPVRRPAGVA